MPRGYLNKEKYRKQDLIRYLVETMASKHITQAEMGKVLGLSQQGFSYKKKNAEFSYTELLLMFHYLQATDKEILKLMRLEKERE